jgi:uncharacterized protein YfaS (alpha-2-macroglobulin family)
VADVSVELLNDEGDVLATTVTDQRGNYRFDQFAETGDYQIRIAASDNYEIVSEEVLDILIPTGNSSVRNANFVVRLIR